MDNETGLCNTERKAMLEGVKRVRIPRKGIQLGVGMWSGKCLQLENG